METTLFLHTSPGYSNVFTYAPSLTWSCLSSQLHQATMIAAGSPKGIIISVIKAANVQDAVASKALFQKTQDAQPFPFTDSLIHKNYTVPLFIGLDRFGIFWRFILWSALPVYNLICSRVASFRVQPYCTVHCFKLLQCANPGSRNSIK